MWHSVVKTALKTERQLLSWEGSYGNIFNNKYATGNQ